MPVITLTSDFGNKDHFVGSVKGSLNNEIPNVKNIQAIKVQGLTQRAHAESIVPFSNAATENAKATESPT